MVDEVAAIQQLYPQVFHACHVAHTRARTNAFRVSERDSAILAHLGPFAPVTAKDLGRHFGIGAPALSASLRRLEALGYLQRAPRSGRSASRPLQLTALGQRALQATSVLDTTRVTALLQQLSPRERTQAVRGLQLLARAARSLAAAEQTS